MTELGPLAGLTALQSLVLKRCKGVTELAPVLSLPALKTLDLVGCQGLRSFGRLVELLPRLEYITLYSCQFDDLPEEICGESDRDNVLDKVRAHFADLERGQVEDAEVKLFVLGNGGVGKTQTCCSPRAGCPTTTRSSRPTAFSSDTFLLSIEGHRSAVQVRFWDFGGQDIYHGTQALFLQGHAIFVILWAPGHEDGETDEGGVPIRNRPLAYWLDYVRGLAGTDSPVLVVQSQCDEPGQRRVHPRVHTEDFRFLKCLEFSAKTDLGLDMLTASIKEGVRNLLATRPLRMIGRRDVGGGSRQTSHHARKGPGPPTSQTPESHAEPGEVSRDICQNTGKVSDPDALPSITCTAAAWCSTAGACSMTASSWIRHGRWTRSTHCFTASAPCRISPATGASPGSCWATSSGRTIPSGSRRRSSA